MLKLSEAILLGSISTLHTRGRLLNEYGHTCALGAAFIAHGLQPAVIKEVGHTNNKNFQHNATLTMEARKIWPVLNVVVPHPNYPDVTNRVDAIIISLNDTYGWTRPQIAVWVAEIEQQEESKGQECQQESLLSKN